MAGNKPKRNPGRPKAKRGRPYVKGNPMAPDDDGPLGPMTRVAWDAPEAEAYRWNIWRTSKRLTHRQMGNLLVYIFENVDSRLYEPFFRKVAASKYEDRRRRHRAAVREALNRDPTLILRTNGQADSVARAHETQRVMDELAAREIALYMDAKNNKTIKYLWKNSVGDLETIDEKPLDGSIIYVLSGRIPRYFQAMPEGDGKMYLYEVEVITQEMREEILRATTNQLTSLADALERERLSEDDRYNPESVWPPELLKGPEASEAAGPAEPSGGAKAPARDPGASARKPTSTEVRCNENTFPPETPINTGHPAPSERQNMQEYYPEPAPAPAAAPRLPRSFASVLDELERSRG